MKETVVAEYYRSVEDTRKTIKLAYYSVTVIKHKKILFIHLSNNIHNC